LVKIVCVVTVDRINAEMLGITTGNVFAALATYVAC
jgi:hypothetical protein